MSDAINKEAEDIKTMCGRCYAVNIPLYPSGCNEKPENLAGAPLGMYHCPDCGAMVIAGEPHPEVCELCRDRKHPGFDKISAD